MAEISEGIMEGCWAGVVGVSVPKELKEECAGNVDSLEECNGYIGAQRDTLGCTTFLWLMG